VEETVLVDLEDEENERKQMTSAHREESNEDVEQIETLEFEADFEDSEQEHGTKVVGDDLALLKALLRSHCGNDFSSITNQMKNLTDLEEIRTMFTYPSFQAERSMTDVEEFSAVFEPEVSESK
jgi:TATA-binding protein-associated factor Taf7